MLLAFKAAPRAHHVVRCAVARRSHRAATKTTSRLLSSKSSKSSSTLKRPSEASPTENNEGVTPTSDLKWEDVDDDDDLKDVPETYELKAIPNSPRPPPRDPMIARLDALWHIHYEYQQRKKRAEDKKRLIDLELRREIEPLLKTRRQVIAGEPYTQPTRLVGEIEYDEDFERHLEVTLLKPEPAPTSFGFYWRDVLGQIKIDDQKIVRESDKELLGYLIDVRAFSKRVEVDEQGATVTLEKLTVEFEFDDKAPISPKTLKVTFVKDAATGVFLKTEDVVGIDRLGYDAVGLSHHHHHQRRSSREPGDLVVSPSRSEGGDLSSTNLDADSMRAHFANYSKDNKPRNAASKKKTKKKLTRVQQQILEEEAQKRKAAELRALHRDKTVFDLFEQVDEWWAVGDMNRDQAAYLLAEKRGFLSTLASNLENIACDATEVFIAMHHDEEEHDGGPSNAFQSSHDDDDDGANHYVMESTRDHIIEGGHRPSGRRNDPGRFGE